VRTLVRASLVLAALAACCAALYRPVGWANFGGVDEWLLLELNGRGIVSMPHSNRPLNLLWALPATWLTPWRFEGYRGAYLAYTCLSGVLTWALVRRLERTARAVAFLAAVLTIGWAPADMARLQVVQMIPNAAVTASTLACLILLLEFWRCGRVAWFVGALALAAVTTRSYEAALGLLLGAPLLVLAWPRGRVAGPRSPAAWIAAWVGGLLLVAAATVAPMLSGDGSTLYQSSVLGLDLDPGRYLLRLGRQFAWHLGPVVPADPSELALANIGLPVAVFAAAALLPVFRGEWPDRRRLAVLAATGLAMAAAGYSVLLLGRNVTGPTRMQFLSAPGIAILLAAAIGWLASWLRPVLRHAAVVALGSALVAVGAGHLAGMQREWQRISRYPQQRACLAALAREAPALAPGTLLVLVDLDRTWPFSMSFRHAARLVYGGAVTGVVPGADQLLYDARADETGVTITPAEAIRGPWREAVTRHGYDELIVFALSGGRLTRLDTWRPDLLGPLPRTARYSPLARLGGGAPPPSRRVLD
jgi:hypothetical protein